MDRKVKKGSLWRRRGGALFILLSFLLLLLGLTPEKACANGYPTPEGYDHHDYQKLVTFLEYSDGGVKNGKKINANYDPTQPWTWLINWQNIEGTNRVAEIVWWSKELTGSLDVSGCSALQRLRVNNNRLTSVNVSGCPSLQTLDCPDNELTSLNVSNCPSLSSINCYGNNLVSLDASNCLALQNIRCSSNQLTSLNLSGCPSLEILDCADNDLTSLDLSDCRSLQTLKCFNNQLGSLDLSNCPSLQVLTCSSNRLTSLNVSGFSSLQTLNCASNDLISLDVSGCSSLQILNCGSNQLTSLNISGCPVLNELRCSYNRLTFSSLPKFSGTIYTYHPQDPLPIGVGGKIAAGATVNLSAEAVIDGTATTFTWKDDSTGAPINPTTDHNGVFTINEDFIGETIYCEMTNFVFQHLSLETSKVLVVPPPQLPELTTHPQNTTVAEGATAQFNVVANSKDGGELRYQWQVSADGADWKNILGATGTSFTTPTVTFAQNGFQFRCQITNTKDGFSSDSVYSDAADLSVVAKPSITGHPQDATVTEGDTVGFAVAATAPDGGKLSYQWYVYPSPAGKEWIELQDATENKFILPDVTLQSNGTQYKCQVINTRNEVSAAIESTVAVLQVIKPHQITFIKPTADNDEGNPVNINSGSLVLATISGEDISEVTKVTIKVDDNDEEQISPSGNTIYYLLPANISSGKHTITIKLTNTANKTIEETVTFYWDSYRRGFGFGRFNFGEAPAGE